MIIEFRKHIPGCPGEYMEPVSIGVLHADIYGDYLRFRCLLKETMVNTNNPYSENYDETEIDTKCCVLLSRGDLLKCGGEIIRLETREQMIGLAEQLNKQLPPLQKLARYPNKNEPQYDSDTDLYSIGN